MKPRMVQIVKRPGQDRAEDMAPKQTPGAGGEGGRALDF
jgi:hypothetical protein